MTRILRALLLVALVPAAAFAQQTQRIEGQERDIEQEEILRERVSEPLAPAPVEEQLPPAVPAFEGEQTARVNEIKVSGVTLLPEEEISEIVEPYRNRELSLNQMQELVDRITAAYRGKGYVTSRGYLPPQKIRDGVLEIKAIEGSAGGLEIKGNHYFSSAVIERGISLERGEPFNYNTLKSDLSRLNAHPDRSVKAVLVPGKEPGTTDIVLNVEDRLPVHLQLSWDNFGSRYIGKDRYTAVISHNNLLGRDDKFSLQLQTSDRRYYDLASLRYVYPVTSLTSVGFSASRSYLTLDKEFKPLNARGKSASYSLFVLQELVSKPSLQVTANASLDYLDSFNFQLGQVQSRDRVRALKLGLDMDGTDEWGGRNIFSPQSTLGLGSFMGGQSENDPLASRAGSNGNKFVRHNIDYLRLQQLPYELSLLAKVEAQISPNILPASQQFQVGGISNVRGYPLGELVGDEGQTLTLELIMPAYGVPKDIRVPFSRTTLYEALKTAVFFDWGSAQLHTPQAGEQSRQTLYSMGFGFRFNLPEDFSIRLDFAFAMDEKPSDGDRFRPWVRIAKQW